MSAKKQSTLRERLEAVWARQKPDKAKGTELTAEGMETRTPSRDEFFGNLGKTTRPKPPAAGS